MYAWMWRHLPGPRWARTTIVALTLAIVVLALFEWVFPAVSAVLPFQEQTVTS
jgi:polyferredoxin